MKIPVTPLLIANLRDHGIECFLPPGHSDIASNVHLEPPCSLKWMAIEHSLQMGAFSYAVSGYFFGVSIGRYCSIGEQVQIGRGDHPTTWLSTSPAFYLNEPLFSVGSGFSGADHFAGFRPIIPASMQSSYFRPTTIGNDVWIGHGAFIRQGVSIGHGAVIGAQAVVTRDVPPYAVAVGNPASVKKFRVADGLITPLLESQWWRFAPWQLRGIDFTNPELALEQISRITVEELPYQPQIVSLNNNME